MNLIRVGKIGRPHSFRGAFVVQDHSGQNSALAAAKVVWVGQNPETAQSYPVAEAKWAGQGWLLRLNGVDSDEWVKSHVHLSLFLDRNTFPKPDSGEYYVADLVGFSAVDADTEETIGTFVGAEPLPPGFGPDRWWFKVGGRDAAVPAIAEYIVSVDTTARTIRVRGLKAMP
jgi:16S rRNA processing protein RimM